MKLYIQHQQEYSRGELLLRAFFGWLYIGIPYFFLSLIPAIIGAFYSLIGVFSVLFTGVYPEHMFEHQVKLMNWQLRVQARLLNLVDGNPPHGMNAQDEAVELVIEYPGKQSQGDAIMKFFLGFFMFIPHYFVLIFRIIVLYFYSLLAFFTILISAEYPEGGHKYAVDTLRYVMRINLYFGFMNDRYPPFSGAPDEELGLERR
ncbi:DUF4389 domain-containing protein [uncultured Microscilla sp.]|nr:DUF4389 domain-containing protein [uncultured Microscilla sp.]